MWKFQGENMPPCPHIMQALLLIRALQFQWKCRTYLHTLVFRNTFFVQASRYSDSAEILSFGISMKTCQIQNSLFLTDNKQSKKSEGKFCEISINCEVELPDRGCDLNEGDYIYTFGFFFLNFHSQRTLTYALTLKIF